MYAFLWSRAGRGAAAHVEASNVGTDSWLFDWLSQSRTAMLKGGAARGGVLRTGTVFNTTYNKKHARIQQAARTTKPRRRRVL